MIQTEESNKYFFQQIQEDENQVSPEEPKGEENLEDEEDISFELEKIPNDKKDASSNVFTNEKSNDSIKNSEKMIKNQRGKPATNENQQIYILNFSFS